jgi:hypothetical protein
VRGLFCINQAHDFLTYKEQSVRKEISKVVSNIRKQFKASLLPLHETETLSRRLFPGIKYESILFLKIDKTFIGISVFIDNTSMINLF